VDVNDFEEDATTFWMYLCPERFPTLDHKEMEVDCVKYQKEAPEVKLNFNHMNKPTPLEVLLEAEPCSVIERSQKMAEVLEKRLEAIAKRKSKQRVLKNTKKGLVRPKTAGVRSPPPLSKKDITPEGEMQSRYDAKTPLVNISYIEKERVKFMKTRELEDEEGLEEDV
jgi:hypothetical protein